MKTLALALTAALLLGSNVVAAQGMAQIEVGPRIQIGRYVGENSRFCFYRYPDGHFERIVHRSYNRFDRWDRTDRWNRWDSWDRYDRPTNTSRYRCPRTFTISIEFGDRDRDRDNDDRDRDNDRDRRY